MYIQTVLIYGFRKEKHEVLTGLISLIIIGFGSYLWLKNGLILDYAPSEEIALKHAESMYIFAVVCLLSGLGFLLLTALKFIWVILKRSAKSN